MGKVNPRKCNREGGDGGEECRCKDRKYPFVCQFIHKGETKEMYSNRVGFDPEHTKYNNCSYKEYESEYNECGKVVDELDGKIFGKFDLSNIPEKDKAYVRRTQNSIHHLSLKRKWLYKIMNRLVGNHKVKKDDKYYLPLEQKMEKRDKIRADVANGKRVSVRKVFECEDDKDRYDEHLEEVLGDGRMECVEDGYFDDRFDSGVCEKRTADAWVKNVISHWNEQESGIHVKSPYKEAIKPKVSAVPPVHNVKDDVFKEEKKIESNDAWGASGGGARIIHCEKQHELEKRVIAASKAEHERLHRLDEDDYLRDLDYMKSRDATLYVDVNEWSDDELDDEEDDVVRKNEAADRAAVDVRKMKEEALLTGAIKSINEAHVELMRKERYKEKRDKWYYGED
jgi:hypothetical protein